jgi:ProP effector
MTEATPSQDPSLPPAGQAPATAAEDAHAPVPPNGSESGTESESESGAVRGNRPAVALAQPDAAAAPAAGKSSRNAGRKRAAPPQRQGQQRTVHPVLNTLYELYPRLFGARFLPLKLGVYESLMQAHADRLKPEELKVALGLHTRSNRYLEAVASGLPRHDLQGQPVEPVAPEHVHHAIVELYRRKSATPQEPAARARAVAQLTGAIQASGLGREAYRERFGAGGSDAMRALLEEALGAVGQKDAKREAMVRAFQASGATVEAFAEMYGLDPADVARFVEPAAST